MEKEEDENFARRWRCIGLLISSIGAIDFDAPGAAATESEKKVSSRIVSCQRHHLVAKGAAGGSGAGAQHITPSLRAPRLLHRLPCARRPRDRSPSVTESVFFFLGMKMASWPTRINSGDCDNQCRQSTRDASQSRLMKQDGSVLQ